MANPKSQISTLEDEASGASVVEAKELPSPKGNNGLSGVLEVVTIHSSPEDGGSNAVFVQHNGYAYQIPRDQPFKIPTEVAQILRDAKVTSYKAGAGGAFTEKETPRFAFSAVPA